MASARADDWDQHWTNFGAASEVGPTPKYRRRLIFRLLEGIAKDGSARMLEIGSGTGEFAEEFCRRFPRSRFLGQELSALGVETSKRRISSATFVQRDLLQPAGSQAGLDFRATDALCTEVLEHLDEPGVLLRNAAAYMKRVSGEPSLLVRMAGKLCDAVFHLNLMRWGWQTIAVARYRGAGPVPAHTR